MEGLKLLPMIALMIAIAGMIIGASVISLGKFGDTMTKCYNSSYAINATRHPTEFIEICNAGLVTVGSAGSQNYNLSDQYYSAQKAGQGLNNISEQQPTIAIIAVMVIIITVIASVFVYMKFFG